MNYYRRFPGDYARDTAHLSMLEDGAFQNLLDRLYSTEKPLPVDRKLLFSITKARKAIEKKAVESVLKQFFVLTPHGYTNMKFERELTYAESRAKKASRAAKSRWASDASSINDECSKQCLSDAIQTPDARLQTPDLNHQSTQDHAAACRKPDDHLIFHLDPKEQKLLKAKAEYLAKCEGNTLQIDAAIDIILERA